MPEVLFSICHTTARPDGWQDSYRAWLDNAARPEQVEYILCVDERWGFTELPVLDRSIDTAVWNTGRKCLVDGANIAAANAFGKVLIINSDDFVPGKDWDLHLLHAIQPGLALRSDKSLRGDGPLDDDFVIRTYPGEKYQAWLDHFVEAGRDPIIGRLMTLQILSRTRYQRFGYALYPEFTSMMADTDFTAVAEHDGVVIEARHITIEHRHPFVTGAGQDSVSKHENEMAAHELGARIFARRQAERSGGVVRSIAPSLPKVAVLLPGQSFDWRVMDNWSRLLLHLAAKCQLSFTFECCSNQYFARDFAFQALQRHVKASGEAPEYVLWLDSDNMLTPEGFDLLLDAMQSAKQLSAIAGWYWIDVQPPQICARVREVGGKVRSVTFDELQAAYDNLDLIEITDHSGFGAMLMRYEVMQTAGNWPFCPMLQGDDTLQWPEAPYLGDDVSFCRRAIQRGYRFFLHPEVYLPHLKTKEVDGPKLRARPEKNLANAAD